MDRSEIKDLIREIEKINDVLFRAASYFANQSEMNAELHMSDKVRITPLGVAVENAASGASGLLIDLRERVDDEAKEDS